MKIINAIIFIVILITSTVQAKTIDQKKEELKKIYEAGGISKVEYEKSVEFLEEPKKEKKNNSKKKFSIKSKKTNSKNLLSKKDEELEKITLEKIDELGKPVKFDKSYYPDGMLRKFIGCGKGMKCVGDKAGQELYKTFTKNL